jgi:hypothetical protein
MDMKRRRRQSKSRDQESQVPAWILDEAPKRKKPYTKAEMDGLAADVQAGIQDTPVWKEYVRRFGKQKAIRIHHIVQGDPNNSLRFDWSSSGAGLEISLVFISLTAESATTGLATGIGAAESQPLQPSDVNCPGQRLPHGREHQAYQDGNNRHHAEDFNQRESLSDILRNPCHFSNLDLAGQTSARKKAARH